MSRIFFYEDKLITQERAETFYIQKIFILRRENFFRYIIVEIHDYILKDEKNAWRFLKEIYYAMSGIARQLFS